jgi:hypothetical protein
MEENDKKRLTEWLGLCWHEWDVGYIQGDYGGSLKTTVCKLCGIAKWRSMQRTFIDPQDFFTCFEKLVERGEWQRFYNYGAIKSPFVHAENTMQWLLSRTESGHYRLCQLTAAWLKEKGQ